MKKLRSRQAWLGLQSTAAAVASAAVLLLCSGGSVVHAQTTLNYTGNVQTYTVPIGAVGVLIQARGAGGGGGGSDGQPTTDGGAGGAGALATGSYPVAGGTSLNIFVGGRGGSAQSNEGSTGNSCASTAGSAGISSGTGGLAGGAGSTAGCSPYSGGGGGGGAASVVALGATPVLIAGGGSGGQGGSLGGNGINGVTSSATGNIATPSAGQNASAPGSDGGGGGGGGGGCPGGGGGLFKPDNNAPIPNTPAGAGSSCRVGTVTGFAVTSGGGGVGGAGAVAYNWIREVASGARSGGDGQVVITPIYQVAVVKSAPTPALSLNTPSAYALTVTNTGFLAATSARVLDQLPIGMTYNSASGTGWSCSAGSPNVNGTLVTCNFSGSIAVGGNSVLTINATPTTSTSKTNRASVDRTGGTSPPSALGCTGTDSPSLGCAAPVTSTLPELAVSKTQPSPALAIGSNSDYTITVINNGSGSAPVGFRLLDQLPANLNFVSATGTGFTCTSPGGAGALVTCDATAALAAGAFRNIVLRVSLTNNLQVVNFVAVDPGGGTNVPSPTSCTTSNSPSNGCGAPVVTTPDTSLSTVSGTVYLDANTNSSLDGGETGTGVTGLFVKLRQSTGVGCTGTFIASAPVNATTGAYSFTNVTLGNRCLIFDNNNTATDNTPSVPAGYTGTQNSTGIIQIAVTTAPELAQNFGLYLGSSLSGTVFLDTGIGGGTANNGARDGAEAGFGGVLVEVRNASLALVGSSTTAADGSYTVFISNTATGVLTVTPVLPSGYLATGGTPGDTGGTYTRPSVSYTPVNGTQRTNANFGIIPPNTFIANGTQSTSPGSVVFYTHIYTPGSAGSVTFALSAVATPAIAGWTQVLYRDTNCSAVFDPAEPQVTGAVAATSGTPICLIVRQQVPPGASVGAQNTINVSATMDYANDTPALIPPVLVVTDTTTVATGSGLALAKLVRNITVSGPGVGTTAVNAAPGATLEYTLTATNNGSQPISTIVINDATPTFTNFVSATCPGTLPPGITACTVSTAPAVGGTGAVTTTLTGSLTPTAQVSVTFRVKVDQ